MIRDVWIDREYWLELQIYQLMFIMAHKDGNKRFHAFLEAAAALYNPAQSTQ